MNFKEYLKEFQNHPLGIRRTIVKRLSSLNKKNINKDDIINATKEFVDKKIDLPKIDDIKNDLKQKGITIDEI
jgi:hypothetical protein